MDFRKNEKEALQKLKTYEILDLDFFCNVEELITRPKSTLSLQLKEMKRDELVYVQQIENPYFDKRKLALNQFAYKTYAFNSNSIFLKYLMLSPRTRLLFLFRRLNTCSHKYSCLESILRKVAGTLIGYVLIRYPVF